MSRVITFSRTFPSYHPRAGEPTGFVEKILKGLYDPDLLLNPPTEFKTVAGYDITKLDLVQPINQFQPKHHTIRAGNRWKAGDWFKPVVWGNDINPKSGRSGPYHSKQIQFAPDIQIKKVWDFKITIAGDYLINEHNFALKDLTQVAANDGLEIDDFECWFKLKRGEGFNGQILCWSESINY